MTTWSSDDLAAIGGRREILMSTLSPDGTARRAVPIWIVELGGELYVRSYHGPEGSWFRQTHRHPHARIAAAGRDITVRLKPADPTLRRDVDAAYARKYGSTGHAAIMTTAAVAATTLRLTPAVRS